MTKKIILFFIVSLLGILYAQTSSFAQSASAFNQKQNAEITAFNQQQVLESNAFYQANQSIIAKLSQHIALTPQEQAVMTAFMQNQQAQKTAFYQELAVEREAFLSSQSGRAQ